MTSVRACSPGLKNPRNFAILAEGPVDEIRKLQVDVDDYLSRLEARRLARLADGEAK